ncbi:MAG: MipA/OmpV family protein [Pseudomonadota bacterium]
MVEKSLFRKTISFLFAFLLVGIFTMPSTSFAADLYGADEPVKTKRIKLGGAAVIKPEYEGSDEYEVTGYPIVGFESMADSMFDGRVSVDGADSVKFALIRKHGFEFGPLGGIRFERDDDDSDTLDGIGDVDTAFVLGGYAKYHFLPKYFAQVSYHQDVTDEDTGYEIKFGVGTEQRLPNGWKMEAYVGGVFSDEEYFDTYFGVTAAQSMSSTAGLGVYNPDDGIKSIEVSLGFEIPLNERWELHVKGQYDRLLDEAADSPIVEDENQFVGVLGLAYYFDWNH